MPDYNLLADGTAQMYNDQLADIKNTISGDAGSGYTTEIGKISTAMDSIKSKLGGTTGLGSTAETTLSRQADVKNIVETENTRLNNKIANIEDARTGQKRMILLNDSYRQKYAEYTKIIIIFVVILALFLGLNILGKTFPVIPSVLIDILTIILVSVGIIYSVWIYYQILRRDQIEFDKLKIPSPMVYTDAQLKVQQEQASIFDLLSTNTKLGDYGCIGSSCCKPRQRDASGNIIKIGGIDQHGTKWDDVSKKCIPRLASDDEDGFTTISQSNRDVKDNAPNEFADYAPYL